MEQSEFGKGLVICLVKFAEHCERWHADRKLFEDMRQKNPDLFDEDHAVKMHMNGVSDHLYEIEVPSNWQHGKLAKAVKELRDLGLDMGHGFNNNTWTAADVEKAYQMCRDIALLIDKKLGLTPDMGTW